MSRRKTRSWSGPVHTGNSSDALVAIAIGCLSGVVVWTDWSWRALLATWVLPCLFAGYRWGVTEPRLDDVEPSFHFEAAVDGVAWHGFGAMGVVALMGVILSFWEAM